jgi:Domain of unknown function (DUF4465)/Secretion system C-terminal sorting domain
MIRFFNAFLLLMIVTFSFSLQSQSVADFNSLPLTKTDTFWNGADLTGGFTDGAAFFPNNFDTTWLAWDGFAYSNMTDTGTPGFFNQYSAITGSGYQSAQYAVAFTGFNTAVVTLTGNAAGGWVEGMYVTNGTYGYLSMMNGDLFSKKFGGVTGDDPDWFLLTVFGMYNGVMVADSVDFYLADYRFSDNSKDYIIKDWQWIDLKPLGNVDSLLFILRSSDTGAFGMNTPAFFCMDDFTTANRPVFVNEIEGLNFTTYPNPVKDVLEIQKEDGIEKISIYDISGREVFIKDFLSGSNRVRVQMNNFENGVYLLSVEGNGTRKTTKLIKL